MGNGSKGYVDLTFFLSVYNNSNNITIKLTIIIVPAFKYHNARPQINQSLSTYQNASDFACVSCSKTLQDPTWALLKASILKEMYRRPLGDTIFGSEFLKSNPIQFFINSKCEECQERLIYEKGKTLAMISEFLKTLPESIDISCSMSSRSNEGLYSLILTCLSLFLLPFKLNNLRFGIGISWI